MMNKALPLLVVATMLSACSDSDKRYHVSYEKDGCVYEYYIDYPDGVDKSTVERYTHLLMTENNEAIVALMDSIIASGTPIDFWCSDYYRAMKEVMPYDSILQRLLELEKREPTNPSVYSTIGYTYSHLNDPTLAIEYFNRSIKLAPDNSNMWYGLGLVMLQKGDTTSAISNLKHSLLLAKNQNLESQILLSQHMLEKLKDHTIDL